MRVSIAILPDGISNGNLEELCIRSLDDTPVMKCVSSYIDCLTGEGPQIADNRLAKTQVYAYLAGGPLPRYANFANNLRRRQPGLRLAQAANAGIWDWNSPAFQQVAEFLRNL